MTRLAVIGAGPIGLAAALGALERGFDVTVFEQGEVGDALRRWGSARLFTPLAMNLPARARHILGSALPPGETLMTGPEMADRVLLPLAQAPPLAGRVLTRQRVLAVGRAGLRRTDFPGHPLRSERPFRLLVVGPDGERVVEAAVVLDASGVYDRPNHAGAGGLPAPGEQAAGERIIRHLGALDAARARLRGRHVLLLGHGHSAANAVLIFEALAAEAPGTSVLWAVRSPNRRPCVEMAGDPLPERRRVAARANDLAEAPSAFLRMERRACLERIEPAGDRFDVTLAAGRHAVVDEIVAMTGNRPDLDILSELALDLSPVTEGAARLARALAGITDCLSVPKVGAADLVSGEPGFFLVGSKSYGRQPSFLLQTGLAQLETILEGLPR